MNIRGFFNGGILMINKIIVFITSCVLILGAGCAKSNTTDKKDDNGVVSTLKLASNGDWGAPEPFHHSSRGPGTGKMNFIFASLLEHDEKGIVPFMAKSYTVNNNEFTFNLYKGLTFHDGTPLTTKDVAFTIDYYKEHPPVTNYLGFGDSFLIDHYDIINDETIKIITKKSNANTLDSLGSFVILPQHIWSNISDPMTYNKEDRFVGSGAYKFGSYDSTNGSYEFIAFDKFIPYKPAAQKVQFIPVSDEILAYENGEIDIASLPADLYATYSKRSDIGIIEKTNDFGYKLLINFEKQPQFNDINLRKGLYYAINRQDIVDKVFRGIGNVGSAGYAPSGSIYFNEDCEKYDYDKDKAIGIFSGKNISINLLCSSDASELKIAELIKNDLEAVGLKVTVSSYDNAVRDDNVNSGDYQFALVGNGGWGGKAPDYLRTIFSDNFKNKGGSPANMGPIGYSNKEVTELADNQLAETDVNKRVEMLKELQYKISAEVPLLVIATKSDNVMFKKNYYDHWIKSYDYQQVEQLRLSYLLRQE